MARLDVSGSGRAAIALAPGDAVDVLVEFGKGGSEVVVRGNVLGNDALWEVEVERKEGVVDVDTVTLAQTVSDVVVGCARMYWV